MLKNLRERVLLVALESMRCGLIAGTSGNVSARDPRTGLIAITPSGTPYETLTPGDLPLINACGQIIEISGSGFVPSSETPLHTEVYKARPDINGVVHTHSAYGTAMSVLVESLPIVTVPLAAHGPVPVVPFKMPGSQELAQAVVSHLGPTGRAVLLRNHGVLCVGGTVEDALICAMYIEEGSKVAHLCLLAGNVNPIPKEAVLAIKAGCFSEKTR